MSLAENVVRWYQDQARHQGISLAECVSNVLYENMMRIKRERLWHKYFGSFGNGDYESYREELDRMVGTYDAIKQENEAMDKIWQTYQEWRSEYEDNTSDQL